MKILLKSVFVIAALFIEIQANGQWTNISESIECESVTTIKTIGDKLYISCSNKIYVSSDKGENWLLVNSISGYNAHFNQIASLGNTIFIARTDSGIYRSPDNGKSWSQVFFDTYPSSNYYRITVIDSILIVSIEGQLHQSIDSGTTWNLTYDATWHNPVTSLISNDTIVFAGISYAILTSTNSGTDWSKIDFADYTMGGINKMVIKDSSLYATNGSRVYKSTDNGINWANITNNLNVNSFKFCFGSVNKNLLISTQHGVFVTTDNGQTWNSANLGLGKTQVNAFDTLGNFIFAATNSGVYRIDNSQITTLPCDYITVMANTTEVPSCLTCSDGTATAYALSGIPPFNYLWHTSPIQTTQTAIGLSQGYYSFCITDSTGCIGCDSVYVDIYTGINEISENLFFHIFPNPVFDYLELKLPSDISKSEIRIFNILGKLEYITTLTKNQTKFDISDLKDGVYIIQIMSGDRIGRQKFIKQ